MAINLIRFIFRLSSPSIQPTPDQTQPPQSLSTTLHTPHTHNSILNLGNIHKSNYPYQITHRNPKSIQLNKSYFYLLETLLRFSENKDKISLSTIEKEIHPLHLTSIHRRQLLKELHISTHTDSSKHYISFEQFTDFVLSHYHTLINLFQTLDKDDDGFVSLTEIVHTLTLLGLPKQDLNYIVEKINNISPNGVTVAEWVKLFLFYPIYFRSEKFNIWQTYSQFIDFGGDFPLFKDDLSQPEYLVVPKDDKNLSHTPKFIKSIINSTAFLHLTSGAIAGAFSRSATAPLDRIKVIMQVSNNSQGKITLRQIIHTILQEKKGALAFFRGNGTNCLKIAPETAIKFFAYDLFKSKLVQYNQSNIENPTHPHKNQHNVQPTHTSNHIIPNNSSSDRDESLTTPILHLNKQTTQQATQTLDQSNLTQMPSSSLHEKLMCGALAGMCAQFTIYPMEVIKTRLALCPTGLYKGIFHCLTSTIRKEGPLALYRGLSPAMLGIIPYAGIDLACFETLKWAWYTHQTETVKDPPIHIILTFGAISSSLGQLFSYPISLIRTRLQADGMGGSTREYISGRHVFITILKREGPLTLYRGIGPNLMKTVPAVSISWAVYETSKKHIRSLVDV